MNKAKYRINEVAAQVEAAKWIGHVRRNLIPEFRSENIARAKAFLKTAAYWREKAK
jgi:hypothetical protein